MRHLEEEEIARFAEGNIKNSEHERFIKHIAECEDCFKAYTGTLKFVEEERKRKTWWRELKIPGFKKLRDKLRLLPIGAPFAKSGWHPQPISRFAAAPKKGIAKKLVFLTNYYRVLIKKVLVPAFASLIIILIIVPILFNYLQHRRINNDKIQHISEIVTKIEINGIHTFAGIKGKLTAAIRAGIFVEDLCLLVNISGKEELIAAIANLLRDELKKLTSDGSPIFGEPVNIERKNFENIVKRIRDLLVKKKSSLVELFRFGRFVEHSILSAYEEKQPDQGDIEKYQKIARMPDLQLPEGVPKELKKLKTATDVEKSKDICIAIKEIFLFPG